MNAGTPGGADGADATEPAATAWLELSVVADHEAVEAVSEVLSRVAPGGISVEPGFETIEGGFGARVDPARPAIVRAYLRDPDAPETTRAVEATTLALGHLQAFALRPIGELRTRVVADADWTREWRQHFPVIRIGERFVIRPTWRRHRRRPADVVIGLDPGVAFGTGLHPSTRLAMAALEALDREGRVAGARVLDVGCGSGILSLGAARLGAASVVGVDPDPLAVEATQANARRNRLTRRIRARHGSLPSGERDFDIVLANLVAGLLIELAGDLRREVRPGATGGGAGGVLVASGIFEDRESDVRRAFGAVGLDVTRRWTEGEWVALAARPPTIEG